MNRLFATYFSGTLSYANASESLLATFTPPYKYPYNQIVSCNIAAKSHLSALPLGILCPVRSAFFVRNFLNINNFITIKTYEDF